MYRAAYGSDHPEKSNSSRSLRIEWAAYGDEHPTVTVTLYSMGSVNHGQASTNVLTNTASRCVFSDGRVWPCTSQCHKSLLRMGKLYERGVQMHVAYSFKCDGIYLPKHPIRRQRVPEVFCVQSAPSPCTISIIISSIIDDAWHHAFHFSNHRRLYIADAFLGKKKPHFASVTHISQYDHIVFAGACISLFQRAYLDDHVGRFFWCPRRNAICD
jgi:hypothetical protein